MNDPLERLLQGNRRFYLGRVLRSDVSISRRCQICDCQQPFALILGCSDSRVPPEIIFDCGLGDLFVIRTAGNTIDKAVMETILFGIRSFHIPMILVLGHSDCGVISTAIRAVEQMENHENISCIMNQIVPAMEQCRSEDNLVNSVVRAHVKMTAGRVESLMMPVSGDVKVLGGYYDLNTGIVEILGA